MRNAGILLYWITLSLLTTASLLTPSVPAQSGCTPTWQRTNSEGQCGNMSDLGCNACLGKTDTYNIYWPDGDSTIGFQVFDFGECEDLSTSCCSFSTTHYECWPDFQAPTVGYGYWQQTTYTEGVDLVWQDCSWPCPGFYKYRRCVHSALAMPTITENHIPVQQRQAVLMLPRIARAG